MRVAAVYRQSVDPVCLFCRWGGRVLCEVEGASLDDETLRTCAKRRSRYTALGARSKRWMYRPSGHATLAQCASLSTVPCARPLRVLGHTFEQIGHTRQGESVEAAPRQEQGQYTPTTESFGPTWTTTSYPQYFHPQPSFSGFEFV